MNGLITYTSNFRRAALRKWKQKFGSGATYGKLIQLFEHADHKDYADHVKQLCYKKKDAGKELVMSP